MKYIISILVFTVSYCTHKVTNDSEKRQAAFYLATNNIAANTSTPCISSLGLINSCIDKSRGIDPNIMCSSSQLSVFNEADYTNLSNCAGGVIRTTSCNKYDKKEYDARAGAGLFNECQKESSGKRIIEYRYDQTINNSQ